MNSVLGMNFFVFCFLVLIVVFYFSKEARDGGLSGYSMKAPFGSNSEEAFGTSPGTKKIFGRNDRRAAGPVGRKVQRIRRGEVPVFWQIKRIRYCE